MKQYAETIIKLDKIAIFKFLCLYIRVLILIHSLPMMHEVSASVPLKLLISLIVTTIPMMIAPIAILILVLTRPVVPTRFIVPGVHNWRFLRLLHFNPHEIVVLLRIAILELLLAFLYKLRLFARQSDIRHS